MKTAAVYPFFGQLFDGKVRNSAEVSTEGSLAPTGNVTGWIDVFTVFEDFEVHVGPSGTAG